jgi:hypothetical protein
VHPMVSGSLSHQALQGLQQMGGITKVEKKVVSLTIECSIPTKSVFLSRI